MKQMHMYILDNQGFKTNKITNVYIYIYIYIYMYMYMYIYMYICQFFRNINNKFYKILLKFIKE